MRAYHSLEEGVDPFASLINACWEGNRAVISTLAPQFELVSEWTRVVPLRLVCQSYDNGAVPIEFLRFMLGVCAAKKPLMEYINEVSDMTNPLVQLVCRYTTRSSADAHNAFRAFLDYGISPQMRFGRTPLLYSAWIASAESNVRLLLERGADLDLTIDLEMDNHEIIWRDPKLTEYVHAFVNRRNECRAAAIAIAGIKSKCFEYMCAQSQYINRACILPRDILREIAKMVWAARLNKLSLE